MKRMRRSGYHRCDKPASESRSPVLFINSFACVAFAVVVMVEVVVVVVAAVVV